MQTLTSWTKGIVRYGLTVLVGSVVLTTAEVAWAQSCPCDYLAVANLRNIEKQEAECDDRIDYIANVIPIRSTRANFFTLVERDRKGLIKKETQFRLFERGLYVDPENDVVRYGPTCSVIAYSGQGLQRTNTLAESPITTEQEYASCARELTGFAAAVAPVVANKDSAFPPACQDLQGVGGVADSWEWKFGDEYALFNEPVLVGLEPAFPPYCVTPTTGTQIACPY